MFVALLTLLSTEPALAGRSERLSIPNVGDAGLEIPDEPFTFGPGDRLQVKVWKHEDLDGEIIVSPDGTITFPLVGQLQVAGRTYAEVKAALEEGLRPYYTDASVAVNVTQVNNQKVVVCGEALTPSILEISGEMHVLEALVRAGAINPDARTDNILLIRGTNDDRQLYFVDVDALLAGDLAQNAPLQRGDILVVPTRTITNVERFFRHIQGILSPFVSITQVYRNVNTVSGTSQATPPP